jgi:pimeloyl-ACP methyl ester carboxylesterase
MNKKNTSSLVILSLLFFGSFFMSNVSLSDSKKQAGIKPSTFLIVHGAWGGGWAFKQLESILRASGHEVLRPTMTGLGERVHLANPEVSLETHITDILKVIQFEQLEKFILVGHSYGGMVVTAIADRVPEKIERLVYIDGHLPVNGEAMFDLISSERKADLIKRAKTVGDGWNIPSPWPEGGKNVPQPLATFQEKVKLKNSELKGVTGQYILTLEPGALNDAFSGSAKRARSRNWRYHELRTGHNPRWTMPHELAALLMRDK